MKVLVIAALIGIVLSLAHAMFSMTGGPTDEALMRELGCAAVVYKPLPDTLDEILCGVLRARARISAA